MSFGIDLGTQSCRVAVWQNGQPVIVLDEEGNRALPSYVAFSGDGRRFGSIAKAQQGANIENTVFGIKGFLGRDIRDTVIRTRLSRMPYRTSRTAGAAVLKVEFLGNQETFVPEEIVAMQLSKLRRLVDVHTGTQNECPVIAVPPGFSRHQRQALIDACDIAGLRTPYLIDDTSAAALYYAFYSSPALPNPNDPASVERLILVLNMGAGITSASIVAIEQGLVETKVASSNLALGGDHFDEAISKSLAAHLKSKHGIDVSDNPRSQARLLILAERARKELSSAMKASIDLEAISQDIRIPPVTITRDYLDGQCPGIYDDLLKLIKSLFQRSAFTRADIQEVLLVGGTTRMPGILSNVQAYFSGDTPICSVRNVDEAVALGAAIYGVLKGHPEGQAMPEKLEDMLLMDIVHDALGVAVLAESVDLKGPSTLPADGGSFHESVFEVVIPRNTTFPCRRRVDFSVRNVGDRTVNVQVYEGDSKQPMANAFLGSFELHNIPTVPAGSDRAEVVVDFDINSDHSVVVSAKDSKNRRRSMAIRVGRLSKIEKETMQQKAERFDEYDRMQEYRLRRRNDFEEYCYGARESIERLQTGVHECLEWLQGEGSTSVLDEDLERREEGVVELLRKALPPGYFIGRDAADCAPQADPESHSQTDDTPLYDCYD
ncbi:heat shock protein 70 [Coprinellus micaceus]|uniref:Heat shock protein 70 n=1 Tax=Coprinellus micaceus TaxID=71717 RepID=A0A4Y7SLJ5_COPMI|nr:heat shock protein 70 [Coprinellus micaceus]